MSSETLRNQRPTPVSFTPQAHLSGSQVVVRYRAIMSTSHPTIHAAGLVLVSPILLEIFLMESDNSRVWVANF